MSNLLRSEFELRVAALEASPESAAAWLDYGKLCHAHNLLDEAFACYSHVQSTDPKQARAFHLHALIARRRGQFEVALNGFQKTVALSRENGGRGYAPAQSYSAQLLEELGRGDEAEELYNSTIEEFGQYQLVRLEFASMLIRLDRAEEAMVQLTWLATNAPKDSRVVGAMALAERLLGNDERAAELAAAAPKLKRVIPTLDALAAEMRSLTGGLTNRLMQLETELAASQFEAVARGARELIDGGPETIGPRIILARALQGLGQHVDALTELEWVLKHSPDSVEIKLLAARSANRVDRSVDAERWSLEALELGESGVARSIAGEAFVLQSKWDEADAQFMALLEKHETLGVSDWMMWGTAQLALGNHEAGASSFRAVTEVDPNYAPAYFNLGQAFQLLGQHDAAVVSYESAGMLDPRLAGEVSGRIEACRGEIRKQ